jgi:hypothetical protein
MDEGLGVYVKVLKDEEEYLSTFFLSIPERDIQLDEFHTLISGLAEAKYKIEQLLELFENGFDTE